MKYSVKQLAELSKVSIRTLHWYDKVGLLSPAYLSDTGYRVYEEKELLLLQQILFFKELGFSLDEIQKLIQQSDFDHLKALTAQKRVLEQDINRKKELLQTIEKTILHIKDKKSMPAHELYHGFDSKKQKEYEQYLINYRGMKAEKLLEESKKKTAKWGRTEWESVKNEGDAIYKELASLINDHALPNSARVQAVIKRHYALQNRFFSLDKEVYIGLTSLYKDHPDFGKFFAVFHPKMVDFISQAIHHFAEKNLKS